MNVKKFKDVIKTVIQDHFDCIYKKPASKEVLEKIYKTTCDRLPTFILSLVLEEKNLKVLNSPKEPETFMEVLAEIIQTEAECLTGKRLTEKQMENVIDNIFPDFYGLIQKMIRSTTREKHA